MRDVLIPIINMVYSITNETQNKFEIEVSGISFNEGKIIIFYYLTDKVHTFYM